MKIVYQGKTKTGKRIIIRYSQQNDLFELLKFINELSKEKTFIRYQGEQETLESETKYLNLKLEAIKNKKAVHLLVYYDYKLIAASDIHMMDKTEKHVGNLAISVLKHYRNDGVGNLLMELVLKEAENELPDLKIVTLEVYSTNTIAQGMYEKFGFVKFGKLPNGIIRSGNLEDAILMYKNIHKLA